MNIIVVGAGKVGYALSEQLSREGNEITVIDTNSSRLQDCISTLDIQGVNGNGTSYRVQKEAGIENADLLIAVSNKDEINLLSCLIAKKAGNCQTIARVRDPEYFEEIRFIKEELGLSMSINPEKAAANEIANLIRVESAMEVDSFAGGRINMIRFKIPPNSILSGMQIMDIQKNVAKDFLVCVIERGDRVIMPKGDVYLEKGDVISVVMQMSELRTISEKIGTKSHPIKDVMIAGGGNVSYYVAKMLIQSKIKVKIIEKEKAKCEALSELLPKAIIINADASDRQVLLEEGIKQVDAFVSLTNLDEENIMLSLYANSVSKAKLMTKINKITFEDIIKGMPIGSIICPKNITAERIIRYVRAMQNSMGSNIETLYKLVDNRVEALEFKVKRNARTESLLGIPLMELSLIPNLIVCGIIRDGNIITPSGRDTIEDGDNVIIVTTNLGLNDLSDIIKG